MRSQPRIAAAITSALIALLIVTGCDSASSSSQRTTTTPVVQNDAPAAPTTHVVKYEVEGSTDYAAVTMSTPTGTRQAKPDVPMKLKDATETGIEVEFQPGAFLYISAQNQRGHGTITCRISVDGRVVSENTSSGGYSIATCDATAR